MFNCCFSPPLLVVKGNSVHMLDLAAKLDSTAEYICKKRWAGVEFPPPFGRDALPEVYHTVYNCIEKLLFKNIMQFCV